MKGVLHIHSNYSKDSNCSLEELTQKSRTLGYGFLIITDHIEDMDMSRQQELIDNCKRLSMASGGLKVIPGIEVRFKNKTHILIIGIRVPIDLSDTLDIELLRKTAEAQGALMGVAHLSRESDLSSKELGYFDFIELWSARQDMRFPSLRNLRMVQRISNICAIGGVDSHSIDEFGLLWVETKHRDIIEAIRQKRVVTASSLIKIDAYGRIVTNKAVYYTLYFIWICLKYIAIAVRQMFAIIKQEPPEILKKIKRRLIG